MMAIGKRLAAGLDDIIRRAEIGLADPEIDDRLALRFQRLGPTQYLERRFRSQASNPFSKLHVRIPFPCVIACMRRLPATLARALCRFASAAQAR